MMLDWRVKNSEISPHESTIAWHKSVLIHGSYSGTVEEKERTTEVTKNLNEWEVREYEALILTLTRVTVNGSRDQLIWRLNARETFSVNFFTII